jgi:MFS family permease
LETLPINEDIPPTTSTWEKLRILRARNFGLMWVGGSVSMLGDAFTMVALPWLVIQLTDSAFALGLMLAIESIPRAFFILIGGALTDRISPRLVMIATKLLYMILMALLAVLVLSTTIELWMVFVLAFLFGMVGAFAFPAHSAILPQIVSKEELPFANSIMGGITQICFLVGPALAGLLIVWLGGEKGSSGLVTETQNNLHALGIIFVIDALTYAVTKTKACCDRSARGSIICFTIADFFSSPSMSVWLCFWPTVRFLWVYLCWPVSVFLRGLQPSGC